MFDNMTLFQKRIFAYETYFHMIVFKENFAFILSKIKNHFIKHNWKIVIKIINFNCKYIKLCKIH